MEELGDEIKGQSLEMLEPTKSKSSSGGFNYSKRYIAAIECSLEFLPYHGSPHSLSPS